MSEVIDLSKSPKYRPRPSRMRTVEPTRDASEFKHRHGFWPLNETLEDQRCGYDPRNHRGRSMYKLGLWA